MTTEKKDYCQVCGRTPRQLQKEFHREIKLSQDQGITKCQKCIHEYQQQTPEKPPNDTANTDWKKQITA